MVEEDVRRAQDRDSETVGKNERVRNGRKRVESTQFNVKNEMRKAKQTTTTASNKCEYDTSKYPVYWLCLLNVSFSNEMVIFL